MPMPGGGARIACACAGGCGYGCGGGTAALPAPEFSMARTLNNMWQLTAQLLGWEYTGLAADIIMRFTGESVNAAAVGFVDDESVDAALVDITGGGASTPKFLMAAPARNMGCGLLSASIADAWGNT